MIRDTRRASCVLAALACFLSVVYSEKYKLCVVDGKGGFKRSGRYCPILDKPDSKVECVLGVDRLDCLRRISKGKVDFSVFTPEDLVTATNSEIEVLITNELRYTKDKFEYQVVAVINNNSKINNRHDLKDKKFCHPGYGYETDWTRILSNYLEASTIPQSCQQNATITENRIKASSNFFKAACKPGPWVNNPTLDAEMKTKYPNLCALCDNPSKCATTDKYWGRRGPLFCLTDGAGDVAWARLDDVRAHFGLEGGANESSPDGYSFLCPDGTTKAVNSKNPCVWVVKPWPAIATKRTKAQEIQEFISTLSSSDAYSWQPALLNLIKTYHLTIAKLEPIEAIESFLDRATGFLNANSFTGCHPPRTIRICTTSVLENAKCSWLRESSAVYGIEPDLDCLKADNTTHCMQALNDNVADVVMVSADLLHSAVSKFNLKTLFYETVADDAKYVTVAVTKSKSGYEKLEDVRGKRACFPIYDGIAWNSVAETLRTHHLSSSCPLNAGMAQFFGPSCVPGLPQSESGHLRENCKNNVYNGEFGAIKCLMSGSGDVAFVSKNSLLKFIRAPSTNALQVSDFNILCENKSAGCHLSWAPAGQAMIRANSSDLWMKDTLDVFMQLDNLFGKNHRSLTTPLQIFGAFDGKSDVLFSDETLRFRSVPTLKNTDSMERPYGEVLKNLKICVPSSSAVTGLGLSLVMLSIFFCNLV